MAAPPLELAAHRTSSGAHTGGGGEGFADVEVTASLIGIVPRASTPSAEAVVRPMAPCTAGWDPACITRQYYYI